MATFSALLDSARKLAAARITPATVGRAGWRATVQDTASRTGSLRGRSGPTMSRPLMTAEQLRAYQARERAKASPSDIARAERDLASVQDRCPRCDGGRWIRYRRAGQLPLVVPCTCVPLHERAALAGIPRRHRALTLDTFPASQGKKAALKAAREWASGGIVFASAPGHPAWGTGKTGLGCALLLRTLEGGGGARFVFAPDFLDEIRSRFDSEGDSAKAYVDNIAAEPLLMLDDLGAENPSPWTREQMRRLIDRRWRQDLPTIVTTNCTSPGELAELYGGAVASRIADWRWVAVGGADMRGAAVSP